MKDCWRLDIQALNRARSTKVLPGAPFKHGSTDAHHIQDAERRGHSLHASHRTMIKRILLIALGIFLVVQFGQPDRGVPAVDPSQDR